MQNQRERLIEQFSLDVPGKTWLLLFQISFFADSALSRLVRQIHEEVFDAFH